MPTAGRADRPFPGRTDTDGAGSRMPADPPPATPPDLRDPDLHSWGRRRRHHGPSPEDTLDGVWFRELLAYDHGDAPGLFMDLVERLRRAALDLRARLAERADARQGVDADLAGACHRLAASARELGLGRLSALLRAAGPPDPTRPGDPAARESVTPARLVSEIDRGLDQLLDLADEDGDASRPQAF